MSKRVDFDNFTENYNQLLNEKTRYFSSNEEYFARYKIDLVCKRVNLPVKRLLEYGCGIGRNISFLRQAFPNAVIVGSDISRASLEIAQRDHAGVEFVREDENTGSIGQFDLIFVAGVFHHVPQGQRVEVARVLCKRLSPGGLLFVFEHNPFNPVTRRIVSNCPYDEDAVLLKPSELQDILGQAALSIVHKSYCLFVPPRFTALARLESRLGWLPLGGQYWIQARRS
jgi:trans-aconitate methyltransferase